MKWRKNGCWQELVDQHRAYCRDILYDANLVISETEDSKLYYLKIINNHLSTKYRMHFKAEMKKLTSPFFVE